MEDSPAPGQSLEAAFDRGDFAAVRSQAEELLRNPACSEAERSEANDYLRRIAPPAAARFALWLTAALVTLLSVYFAFLRQHP